MFKRTGFVLMAFVVGILVGSVGLAFADSTFEGLPVVSVILNGKPVQSDVPGVILSGRTMLPVKAIADNLGLDVKWDGSTRTVTLTSKAQSPKDAVYTDKYISASNVTVRRNSFASEVLVEITNVNSKTVTGFLSITFYDAKGQIIGKASGAVNELAPGNTKTVTLLETADVTGYASYKVQTDAMITE